MAEFRNGKVARREEAIVKEREKFIAEYEKRNGKKWNHNWNSPARFD